MQTEFMRIMSNQIENETEKTTHKYQIKIYSKSPPHSFYSYNYHNQLNANMYVYGVQCTHIRGAYLTSITSYTTT